MAWYYSFLTLYWPIGKFFVCPWSVRTYWPHLLCLIPWNLEKASQVEQSDELLCQWQFVPNAIFDCQTARLPRRNNWQSERTVYNNYGGNNDLSMRCSLAFIFDPAILAWADTLKNCACLSVLCLLLFTLCFSYVYHYVLQVSPDDFYILLPSHIGPTLDQLLLQGTLKFDWL